MVFNNIFWQLNKKLYLILTSWTLYSISYVKHIGSLYSLWSSTANKQIPNNVKQIYAMVYAVSISSALEEAHLVEIV